VTIDFLTCFKFVVRNLEPISLKQNFLSIILGPVWQNMFVFLGQMIFSKDLK